MSSSHVLVGGSPTSIHSPLPGSRSSVNSVPSPTRSSRRTNTDLSSRAANALSLPARTANTAPADSKPGIVQRTAENTDRMAHGVAAASRLTKFVGAAAASANPGSSVANTLGSEPAGRTLHGLIGSTMLYDGAYNTGTRILDLATTGKWTNEQRLSGKISDAAKGLRGLSQLGVGVANLTAAGLGEIKGSLAQTVSAGFQAFNGLTHMLEATGEFANPTKSNLDAAARFVTGGLIFSAGVAGAALKGTHAGEAASAVASLAGSYANTMGTKLPVKASDLANLVHKPAAGSDNAVAGDPSPPPHTQERSQEEDIEMAPHSSEDSLSRSSSETFETARTHLSESSSAPTNASDPESAHARPPTPSSLTKALA